MLCVVHITLLAVVVVLVWLRPTVSVEEDLSFDQLQRLLHEEGSLSFQQALHRFADNHHHALNISHKPLPYPYHNQSQLYFLRYNASSAYSTKAAILFIKTHKTASSTLNQILWRQLCILEHKNCFIPEDGFAGVNFKPALNRTQAQLLSSTGTAGRPPPFDAWLQHTNYHPFLHTIIKVPTLVLSIVRRPSFRLASAWSYYHLSKKSGCPLSDVVDSFLTKTKPVFTRKNKIGKGMGALGAHVNSMSNQLLDRHHVFNVSFLQKSFFPQVLREGSDLQRSIQNITSRNDSLRIASDKGLQKQAQSIDLLPFVLQLVKQDQDGLPFWTFLQRMVHFDVLVLVAERFDESMLVLRYLLQWKYDHSWWYLPQKVQKASSDLDEERPLLTLQHVLALDLMQARDYLLFQLANEVLDEAIKVYGKQQFKEDLKSFQKELSLVQDYCLKRGYSNKSSKTWISFAQGKRWTTEHIENFPEDYPKHGSWYHVNFMRRKCKDMAKDHVDHVTDFHKANNQSLARVHEAMKSTNQE